MAELIGRVLSGRYEILEQIGGGGMARVYRARHIQLKRMVAVKVMLQDLAGTQDFRTRFEREARLIAQLHHPNIIEVFDFDSIVEENLYYMVVRLIDGLTLLQRINQARQSGSVLPLEETLRISRDLANALEYAHARNMVHGDIKPSNILLQDGHQVILSDFGLAHLIPTPGETNSLATGGGLLGTPSYVAPEQSIDGAIDPRSDLYSLGVVMYQMVTNHLPFSGETPVAIILKHINDIPESPRILNPNVPVDVEQIILRLLAKSPEARFQTASGLIAAFDKANSVPSVGVPPTTEPLPTIQLARTEKRVEGLQNPQPRRQHLLLLGVLALILLLGIVFTASRVLNISVAPMAVIAPTATYTTSATATSSPTITLSPTASFTQTSSATASFTITHTLTMTPILKVCRATIVDRVVDLRAGPGKSYRPVGIRLRAGTLVTVIGTAKSTPDEQVWWLVQINEEQSGWLADASIKRDPDCGAIPTVVVVDKSTETTTPTLKAVVTTSGSNASTRNQPTARPATVQPTSVIPTSIPTVLPTSPPILPIVPTLLSGSTLSISLP